MKLPPIILAGLILVSVACAAVIPVQPIKVQGSAMLPAPSTGEAEEPKSEIDLALEDAKKRGEPILAACLEAACSDNLDEKALLKGKALELPPPTYPAIARVAHISGTVTVRVIIGTEGNVIAAAAIDGHPLLRGGSVGAARNARFTPTLYDGKPVKVIGDIHYNFVAH
jgi:outer membrane biosynthesis protein TonB